jgi:peptidoglycan/LPS O-acetylase OafA/YrhL
MTFYYNPAFWSLPSEVEYYLLLPLLAAFSRGRLGRFAALVVGALLVRLAIGYASDPDSGNRAFIWLYHLPGMGLEFLLGACAWRLAPRLRGAAVRLALLAAGLVGWLALAALFATQGDGGLNSGLLRGQITWLAALCFAAMVAATALPPGNAPMRVVWLSEWAGRLSYGTYLLHIAALRVIEPYAAQLGPTLATLAGCTLTLGGAWLMYRVWEDPWRRFGRRLAAPHQDIRPTAAAARS